MICAVIVAAGKGKRMREGINKQYIRLGEKEVIAYTLQRFSSVDAIDRIIVVTGDDEIEYFKENILKKYKFEKDIQVVAGGAQRQQSVYNGLKCCPAETDIVLIHDGARPFVSKASIMDSIVGAQQHEACTVAVPVKDTVKRVDCSKDVEATLDRDGLYLIQTPQTFRYQLIMDAHERAKSSQHLATDDTRLVEELGIKVRIIEGDYFNIKLTTPEDLVFGNAILQAMEKR